VGDQLFLLKNQSIEMKHIIALTFTLAAIHLTLAFNTRESKVRFDQPVDYKLAQECVALYKDSGEVKNVLRTESIEFSKDSLALWMEKVGRVSKYTTIRVTPGLYTKAMIKRYGLSPSLENRLTVFLFPYNEGVPATKTAAGKSSSTAGKNPDPAPVDPFNLGNVHP